MLCVDVYGARSYRLRRRFYRISKNMRWTMNSQISGMLFSFSILTASLSPAVAQGTQLFPDKIVVGSGTDIRCELDKGLRITKAGEPVTARVVEPVYVGTVLAIPEGSTIQGHVSFVSTAPLSKRTGRLLRGYFTPPHTSQLAFD